MVKSKSVTLSVMFIICTLSKYLILGFFLKRFHITGVNVFCQVIHGSYENAIKYPYGTVTLMQPVRVVRIYLSIKEYKFIFVSDFRPNSRCTFSLSNRVT